MPELPEVETIYLGLERLIKGKRFESVTFDVQKSFPNSYNEVDQFMINATVIGIQRRGKALLIELNSNYSLIVHLRMTGQLVYEGKEIRFGGGHPSSSLLNSLPDKSTRVVVTFTDGSKLYFNDQRKFGWMRLYPTSQINSLPFFAKLGPDPLDNLFTWQDLRQRLQKRTQSSIKSVLLDQGVVSGVGNIYADESLWGAQIHPATKVQALKIRDYKALYASLVSVLRLSIEKGGSTDRNYVNAEGKKGNYLEIAKVFRKEGRPCPRCGTEIIKIRFAGRGTHLCPRCQKVKTA